MKKPSDENVWVCPALPGLTYKYSAIKQMVKTNNVPKEWKELYEGISRMIKEDFEKNPQKTSFFKELEIPYGIGMDYYKDGKQSPYSPAILLNEYLSKRLASEGYYHASMRMIFIPSKGSMWAREINAMRMREYEIAHSDWARQKQRYDTQEVNEILGPVASPGKEPTPPSYGEEAYQSSKYVIMVQCSRCRDKAAEKTLNDAMRMQRSKTKSKIPGSMLVLMSYVLPILALLLIVLAVGALCTLAIPDLAIEIVLGLGIPASVIVGAIIGWGFHSKLYKNGYL